MANEVIYKRPNETITYFTDFNGVVGATDTGLTATAVTGIKSDGTVDNSVIASSSASGTKLTAVLSAGTDGQDYLITFSAKGNVTINGPWERTVEMRVRSSVGIGNV